MMKKLNNIKWNNKILYHGTTKKLWDDVEKRGFKIPIKEKNWLGRGIYFGVNNFITPMKYAFDKVKNNKDDQPLIVRIHAKDLKLRYLNKILDLTSHDGMIYFYLISKKFKGLIEELNEEDEVIKRYRENLGKSKFYSDTIKKVLTLDIEWYSLIQNIQPIIGKFYRSTSPLVRELIDICNYNISNLIIDWYNYLISGGQEKDIPISGIIANFNTGDPLVLSGLILDNFKNRIFYDYVSFLNRTELSIFGFKYYRDYNKESYWNIKDLFINNNFTGKYILGEVSIKNHLMEIINNLEFPDFIADRYSIDEAASELIKRVKSQVDEL